MRSEKSLFKKILPIILIVAIIIVFIVISFLSPTYESSSKEQYEKGLFVNSGLEMEDNAVYVWHNTGGNLRSDLAGSENAFMRAAFDRASFSKGNKEIAYIDEKHIMWFKENTFNKIPVVDGNKGDEILFITSKSEDVMPIVWERYLDYGYTIGLSNLRKMYGHFYIPLDESGFSGSNKNPYIAPGSDLTALKELKITSIFLDKVGNVRLEKVTDAGTIGGLKKDGQYMAEFYIGSFYQDYSVKADERALASFERFEDYKYEYLHSNCVRVIPPPYLESGYYLIGGVGLIKYIKKGDNDASPINTPIIKYNPDGSVREDPSVYYNNEGDSGL